MAEERNYSDVILIYIRAVIFVEGLLNLYVYAFRFNESSPILIVSFHSFCHSFAETRPGGRGGPVWNAG